MKYTVRDFNAQFPSDDSCLEFIWQARFPKGITCKCGKADAYHRCVSRRCYSCAWCGVQVYPTEGTIFHGSRTSLKSWFFAMFLMSTSKNGVAAKELQRQLGVTYKTAWRMAHQIRKLMAQGGNMMTGIVEADETLIGGRARFMHQARRKKVMKGTQNTAQTMVAGLLERGGEVRAVVVPNNSKHIVLPNVYGNVEQGATVHTDELKSYNELPNIGYVHAKVSHSRSEYVRAEVHTNGIEGFWSQLKRSIHGTFHAVSRTHLQGYVNEFVYRYNRRKSLTPLFADLSARVSERHVEAA